MAELVTRLEQRDADARFELFGNALEYKQRWSDELERCERSNLSIPDPRPHPDDIIVDPSNGNVRILGPQTRKQKAHYDQATARRIEAQDEVNYFAEKYRRARSEEMKERYLEGWHWEQRMFDIINDTLPERYKMKLENRSYRPGASRAGDTIVSGSRSSENGGTSSV